MISAAGDGDTDTVKRLLEEGAYIHTQDEHGRCALVAAAYNNRAEVFDLLVAAGADVNMKDDSIQSAFLIAAMGADDRTELLKKAIAAGADVNSTDSDNGTGLIRASDRGHVDVVRELLATDVRVNHVNRIGWTALLEAIILGGGDARHTEIVRLLVAAGADVNLPDKEGVTPLAHAESRKFTRIAAILKDAGAV
jgi:ankyrin repeat protein